ncbi:MULTISPECIES: hypothetical protein, partial [unclassified Imperialibacter]
DRTMCFACISLNVRYLNINKRTGFIYFSSPIFQRFINRTQVIKKVRDAEGCVTYFAEIDGENRVHRVQFDEDGFLLTKEADPVYLYDKSGQVVVEESYEASELSNLT